jgi:hypothetical protein
VQAYNGGSYDCYNQHGMDSMVPKLKMRMFRKKMCLLIKTQEEKSSRIICHALQIPYCLLRSEYHGISIV